MRQILIIGTTVRITRLVTRDELGRRLLLDPVEKWATGHEGSGLEYEDGRDALDSKAGWRSFLASGLECSYCVGFWIGAGVLASQRVAARSRVGERIWNATAAALTLNAVVGPLVNRMDG